MSWLNEGSASFPLETVQRSHRLAVQLQFHRAATRNTRSCKQFEGEFASVFSALSAVNDSEIFKMGTEIPECLISENVQRVALASRQSSFLVTFALGCPHYSSGVPPALRLPQLKPNNPVAGVYHNVERNERLSDIAKAYDVDLQHLAEVNNLRPPYSIKADTKVFVPGASQQRPVAVRQKPPTERTCACKTSEEALHGPWKERLVSEYGVRGGIQYNGIGIQTKEGTPVTAAADGRVGHVETIGEYGKVVLIEHANRLVTVYAHLKEIRVANDQSVKRGEIIGTVGTSGRVETPSLYFEVRSRSKPRNPLFFLGRRA